MMGKAFWHGRHWRRGLRAERGLVRKGRQRRASQTVLLDAKSEHVSLILLSSQRAVQKQGSTRQLQVTDGGLQCSGVDEKTVPRSGRVSLSGEGLGMLHPRPALSNAVVTSHTKLFSNTLKKMKTSAPRGLMS